MHVRCITAAHRVHGDSDEKLMRNLDEARFDMQSVERFCFSKEITPRGARRDEIGAAKR